MPPKDHSTIRRGMVDIALGVGWLLGAWCGVNCGSEREGWMEERKERGLDRGQAEWME